MLSGLLNKFRRKPEPQEDDFKSLEAAVLVFACIGIEHPDIALYRVLCKARGVKPKA